MACRTEDMGTIKRLRIYQSEVDGDVHVAIVTGRGLPLYDAELREDACVEYCMSGCHSPRTRAALIAVIEAMRQDDSERPDLHRPEGALP